MRYRSKLPIDEDDVSLIFEDIYLGRSAIPPHPVPSRPVLIRWDPEQPVMVENCVVMDWGEAERHLKECFGSGSGSGEEGKKGARPEDVWGKEIAEIVWRRRKEIGRVREWTLA